MIFWLVLQDAEVRLYGDGDDTIWLKKGDVVNEREDCGEDDEDHLCFFPSHENDFRFWVPNAILECAETTEYPCRK